ncbi:MAG: hypothetical protein ACTS6P_01600 [Candidatus Hodgkinia cicadicola]
MTTFVNSSLVCNLEVNSIFVRLPFDWILPSLNCHSNYINIEVNLPQALMLTATEVNYLTNLSTCSVIATFEGH